MQEIPAGIFFSNRVGSIDIEDAYQGVRGFLPQLGEDPMCAVLDIDSVKFLIIPMPLEAPLELIAAFSLFFQNF